MRLECEVGKDDGENKNLALYFGVEWSFIVEGWALVGPSALPEIRILGDRGTHYSIVKTEYVTAFDIDTTLFSKRHQHNSPN